MKKDNGASILIASFAGNADVWPIMDFFLKKYWPDCPYPIFLGANGDDRSSQVPSAWRYLNLGPDRSWSESMREYLSALPSENVFLLLDDFLLTGCPNAVAIDSAVAAVDRGEADYVILHAKRFPGKRIDDTFSRVRKYDDALTTLKPEIWNKRFFADLLATGLNPWEFERKACLFKQARSGRYWAVTRDAYPINHCLEKGRYQPWLADYLQSEGCIVALDEKRPTLTQAFLDSRRKKHGLIRRSFFSVFKHTYLNYLAKKIHYSFRGPTK